MTVREREKVVKRKERNSQDMLLKENKCGHVINEMGE